MPKEPIVLWTIADRNNFPYAVTMLKSFRHFHDWPAILYTNETDKEKLKLLPDNIQLADLTLYSQDKMIFYRSTPIISEPLLDKYECVLKVDSDSLILGNLSPIKDVNDADICTVINWNRFDEKFFPLVQGWGIFPAEYFNCGFVAMRSKKFVHDWKMLCFTQQFDRLQYKEQDLLNALCYFGNYNIRCLDMGNPKLELNNWYGIVGKGEWSRAIVKDEKIIVPKGFGNTPFPPSDIQIRVSHMGGGANSKKDNWDNFFPSDVMDYIHKEILGIAT